MATECILRLLAHKASHMALRSFLSFIVTSNLSLLYYNVLTETEIECHCVRERVHSVYSSFKGRSISAVKANLKCQLCFFDQSWNSFYCRLSRFQFLPICRYKTDRVMIRDTHSCSWNRVICIFYCGLAVVKNVSVSHRTCSLY